MLPRAPVRRGVVGDGQAGGPRDLVRPGIGEGVHRPGGDNNALSLAGALSGVEMALADAGIPLTLGAGVGAALSAWRVPA